MSLEYLKTIDSEELSIVNLISIISKSQTNYLNHSLEKLDINATQLQLLYEISHQTDINQDKIAKHCNIDKGAVARSIKKLEDKELIIRKIDDSNRRQNKLSLTSKGKETLNQSIELLDKWENNVYSEDIIEKELLKKVLKEIAINSMEFNLKGD